MKSLAEINKKGSYIITEILGNKKLVRRLNEIGIVNNETITLLSGTSETGKVIVLKGQRLAINSLLAGNLLVISADEQRDDDLKRLSHLNVGDKGIAIKINGSRPLRKRLLDMGLTGHTLIKVCQVAPLGDPIEIELRGYKLSLRKEEADYVVVRSVEE
ncbi:ferrous iron transport protein A [Liquorilactobacillus mali]|uniref:Fe2+ transport system protein A n=1 Tax=Liquorilactobacillus mali TaxID=1618 RepID=A0A0R2FL61_9LACO|nr:ferrous iron transport protein A [Liquorilactobacillus mali]KRN28534.1 Fe2+ transport system protein A [Liquorilactobacillus mali]MDN7146181.1 ferrous iron transport protein A [Liquorilactobacillus mali]